MRKTISSRLRSGVVTAATLVTMALPMLGSPAGASTLNPLSPPSVVSISANSAVIAYVATNTQGTGATAPTSVTINASPGTSSCVISLSTQTSCTLVGLVNGTSYTATETPSSNDTVDTTSGASAPFIPLAKLTTPSAINDGSLGVAVSFVADGTDTSYSVQAYSATSSGGSVVVGSMVTGGTCSVAQSPTPPTGTQTCVVGYTPTGALTLGSGAMYVFNVTPTNANPITSTSDYSNAVTTSTALNAPSATANGPGSALVTFTPDGVATTYTITATSSDGGASGSCVFSSTNAVTSSQTCTVNGLTNNHTYSFTVTPAGNSTTSTISGPSASIVIGALLTPTAVTDGPGGAVVTYTADGAATTYVVNAYVATPQATTPVTYTYGTPTQVCSATVTSPVLTGTQSCTVTGLTSSTLYSFTVTPSGGTSTSLESAYSTPLLTVTPLSAPSAISGPVAGEATVSFTPDAKATTYVVNAYLVSGTSPYTYSSTSASCTDTFTSVPVGAQSCVVTGLSVGAKYSFTVTPSGGATTSSTSTQSAPITLAAPTAAPVAVVNGPGTAKVTWMADGVGTTYTVYAQQVSALTGGTTIGSPAVVCSLTNTITPPTGTQTCITSSLVNNDYYTFSVVPSGNSDPAPGSAYSSALQITSALGTPTAVSSASGSATVSFTANGVATTYTVNAYLASLNSTTGTPAGSCVVASSTTLLTGGQSCSVTGLTNASTYVFTVTPSGGANASTVSNASLPVTIDVTPLGTPTVATGASGVIVVSFSADGVASTYTVNAYLASLNSTTGTPAGSCTVTNTVVPKGTQSCSVSGLTNGSSYVFVVVPSGNSTLSVASGASSPIAPTALTAPIAPAAKASPSSLTVTWTPATNVGGSPITGYSVSATAGNVTVSCGAVPATATSCVITGLTPGTTYTVTTTALTATGNASATFSATTSVIPAPAMRSISSRVLLVGRAKAFAIVGVNLNGVVVHSNAAGVRVLREVASSGRVYFIFKAVASTRPGTYHLTLTKQGFKAITVTYFVRR